VALTLPSKPGLSRADGRRPPGTGRVARPAGRSSHGWWPVLFLAPNLAGLALFYLWPIAQNVYYSFTSWQTFGVHTFAGLANYRRLFTDSEVLRSFGHTFVYTGLTVPVSIAIALGLAVLLNRDGWIFRVYRVVLLLPMVTMPAAIGMIWRWIYNGDYGILNAMFRNVGVDPVSWLSGDMALLSISVVGIWSVLGYNLIVLLAGLQTIDKVFYEAAALDGAGPVRTHFSVVIPMLTPTLFFLTVTSLINALQVFDLVFLMTDQDSPALRSSRTAVFGFYEQSFVFGDKGYGATIAVALFAIILVITVIQVRLQKRWVFYG
jgi:multiple sugar transport system permease protein